MEIHVLNIICSLCCDNRNFHDVYIFIYKKRELRGNMYSLKISTLTVFIWKIKRRFFPLHASLNCQTNILSLLHSSPFLVLLLT